MPPIPSEDVYLSMSSEGSRHSGSVQNSVRLAMAPLRLASHSGKPAPEKIDEKESPMTIVYWRDCEAQRRATNDEGIHDDLAPTVLLHASPHEADFVASHTYPTIEKQ